MWVRIVSAILTFIALAGAMVFEYWYKKSFLCNICLAIFGSALLTYVNAFISYRLMRRESIMRYLTDLRKYRLMFKHLRAAGEDERKNYLENIAVFFYELAENYSHIQHLCKSLFVHKHISHDLDCSFQKVKTVQQELENRHFDLERQAIEIDQSADMVEALAKREKYLSSNKKRGNKNGQT